MQPHKKISFYVIFSIASIGLISSICIIYSHLSQEKYNNSLKNHVLVDKLATSNKQISVLTTENNALRDEIAELKLNINFLTKKLDLPTAKVES